MSESRINEALAAFTNWERPWLFEGTVQRFEGLSAPDRQILAQAWSEAIDAEHWRSVELEVGCKAAHEALRKRFPMLSEAALGALVRAASYPWR
ncbi:MAG: hypothetical protein HY721_12860 [Planctomycetes bacterium]|nr:hypothetical protein [Planctomycetota bacterium]